MEYLDAAMGDYTYEDMMLFHTAHQPMYESDGSDENGTDKYQLPVFSLEEIKANSVNAKDLYNIIENPDPVIVNSNFERASIEPFEEEPQYDSPFANNSPFRKTALYLKKLLHREYCYVCKKNVVDNMHYKASCHYRGVVNWLKAKIGTDDPRIMRKVFCEPCNVPIIDDEKIHYSSRSHKNNEQLFCHVCQKRVQNLPSNPQHFYSKGHLKKHMKITKDVTKDFYVTNEVKPPVQPRATSSSLGRASMAKALQDHFLSMECLLCNRSLEKNYWHYLTKMHIKKVRAWIRSNAPIFKVTSNLEGLYCEACNGVFADEYLAKEHYTSQLHKDNLKTFCGICGRHFAHSQMLTAHENKKHKFAVSETGSASSTSSSDINLCNWIWEFDLKECSLCAVRFSNDYEAGTHYYTSSAHSNFNWMYIKNYRKYLKTGRLEDFYNDNSSSEDEEEIQDANNEVVEGNNVNSTERYEEVQDENNEVVEGKSVNSTEGVEEIQDENNEVVEGKNINSTEETLITFRECNEQDQYLKEQIMNQVNLIVERLYYSKMIPLPMALKCLKTLNKDISLIIETGSLPDSAFTTIFREGNMLPNRGDVESSHEDLECQESENSEFDNKINNQDALPTTSDELRNTKSELLDTSDLIKEINEGIQHLNMSPIDKTGSFNNDVSCHSSTLENLEELSCASLLDFNKPANATEDPHREALILPTVKEINNSDIITFFETEITANNSIHTKQDLLPILDTQNEALSTFKKDEPSKASSGLQNEDVLLSTNEMENLSASSVNYLMPIIELQEDASQTADKISGAPNTETTDLVGSEANIGRAENENQDTAAPTNVEPLVEEELQEDASQTADKISGARNTETTDLVDSEANVGRAKNENQDIAAAVNVEPLVEKEDALQTADKISGVPNTETTDLVDSEANVGRAKNENQDIAAAANVEPLVEESKWLAPWPVPAMNSIFRACSMFLSPLYYSQSYSSRVTKTAQDHATLKLQMEINRLKVVLDKRFSVEEALKYARSLRTLIQDINGQEDAPDKVDVDVVFTGKAALVPVASDERGELLLQKEFELIQRLLTEDTRRISRELALDIVTQINFRLENFVDAQKSNCDTGAYAGSSAETSVIDISD